MKIENIKKISDNITEIIIKSETEEWEVAKNNAFLKLNKEVKIDGFRKGKAPKETFVRKLGEEKIYMEAVDAILPLAYSKILDETKLLPIVQPNFELKNVSPEGAEYVVTITVAPEVKIKKYKGLGVKKPSSKVTKEEIKAEIDHILSQYEELEIKTGKIALKDVATIDFEGFKDGVPFEGGKGENYDLEIGSESFIPGFEEQLIGLKKGDKKDLKVTFPKDYMSEDLKGKEVTFKVEIKEVKVKQKRELNKEFFEDLAMEGVTTKSELEETTKEKIQVQKEQSNENAYIDDLLKEVAKGTEVDIPEQLIVEEIERMVTQFEEQIKMQGMDPKQYFEMTGMKEEAIKKEMEPEAKNRVTYRMILEKVAKEEKLEVTDKIANKEADKLAEKYKMPKDKFLEMFGGLEMIKYDLTMKKAMELLKDNN